MNEKAKQKLHSIQKRIILNEITQDKHIPIKISR
jgi:hypothetical protein